MEIAKDRKEGEVFCMTSIFELEKTLHYLHCCPFLNCHHVAMLELLSLLVGVHDSLIDRREHVSLLSFSVACLRNSFDP